MGYRTLAPSCTAIFNSKSVSSSTSTKMDAASSRSMTKAWSGYPETRRSSAPLRRFPVRSLSPYSMATRLGSFCLRQTKWLDLTGYLLEQPSGEIRGDPCRNARRQSSGRQAQKILSKGARRGFHHCRESLHDVEARTPQHQLFGFDQLNIEGSNLARGRKRDAVRADRDQRSCALARSSEQEAERSVACAKKSCQPVSCVSVATQRAQEQRSVNVRLRINDIRKLFNQLVVYRPVVHIEGAGFVPRCVRTDEFLKPSRCVHHVMSCEPPDFHYRSASVRPARTAHTASVPSTPTSKVPPPQAGATSLRRPVSQS